MGSLGSRCASRGRSRILLVDPGGNTTAVAEMPVDLTGVERARRRVYCRGLRATTTGRYVFRVELLEDDRNEWRAVAAVPLRVVFAAPEAD